MAKVKLLVDTDVLIDFLNTGFLSSLFEHQGFEIYYSVVTKKELLSKRGLRESERKVIALMLEDFRVVPLNPWITERYSKLRRAPLARERGCAHCRDCAYEKTPIANAKLEALPERRWAEAFRRTRRK